MLIVEDIALLLTDDVSGRPTVSGTRLDLALAGGLLQDLLDAGLVRISGPGEAVRAGRVVLTGASPTGDALLDGGLSLLAGQRPATPQKVVTVLQKRLRGAVCERLAARGILSLSQAKVLGIFPTARWPAVDSAHEARVRGALRDVLVVGRTPTPLETSIVALLHAVGQATAVVPGGEVPRRELVRRAKTLAHGHVAGTAVARAVADADSASMNAVTMTTIAASG